MPCYGELLKLQPEQLEEAARKLEEVAMLEGRQALECMLKLCPTVLLPGISDELLPVLKQIRFSRQDKYRMSGSYHI